VKSWLRGADTYTGKAKVVNDKTFKEENKMSFTETVAGFLFSPWGCGRSAMGQRVNTDNGNDQKARPDAGADRQAESTTPDAGVRQDANAIRDALVVRDLAISPPDSREVGPDLGGTTEAGQPPVNCHPADGILTGNFADPNLLAGLRRFFGKGETGDITTADALYSSPGDTNVKYVSLNRQNISSLSGLECFTRFPGLDVSGNNLVSLSPLSQLTNLYYLDASNNQIASVLPLSGLKNLGLLHLDNNQIADVAPLSQLTGLQYLSLNFNRIAGDISSLSGLTSLQGLELAGSQITDISALTKMTDLTALNLQKNMITDISLVSAMPYMKTLFLNNNPITSLAPVAGLVNLSDLYFGATLAKDLTPLTNLAKLDIVDTRALPQVTDLTPLIDNISFGAGDKLICDGPTAPFPPLQAQLDALQAKGVTITFE
jgi:Leucine Rich repeats (2 copies)